MWISTITYFYKVKYTKHLIKQNCKRKVHLFRIDDDINGRNVNGILVFENLKFKDNFGCGINMNLLNKNVLILNKSSLFIKS